MLLVATLPGWAERRHAATVAAREAANVLVRAWPNAAREDAVTVAREVAADHGVAPADVDVDVAAAGRARGAVVRVEVTVTMPAITVMGVRAGAWRDTEVAVRRVDDYRSR